MAAYNPCYNQFLLVTHITPLIPMARIQGDARESTKWDASSYLARNLQYAETPTYLRRKLIPQHPDLQLAALIPALEAPHHVRGHDQTPFREGITLDKAPGTRPGGNGTGSFVDVGVKHPVLLDRRLKPGIRCTVRIDSYRHGDRKFILGSAVPPSKPREELGTYWGYTVRTAPSLKAVFDQSSFGDKYDYTVGASQIAPLSVESRKFKIPPFKRLLIVFGSNEGLEDCVENDAELRMGRNETGKLFNAYVRCCPDNGSRSVRTEEAVFVGLAALKPHLTRANP